MRPRQEGILPEELIYKPVEAFHDKNLSPRLVKLRRARPWACRKGRRRYDFFEAKRRDLLAAARRAREQIMADGEQPLAVVAQESGLSKGVAVGFGAISRLWNHGNRRFSTIFHRFSSIFIDFHPAHIMSLRLALAGPWLIADANWAF